ncbi:MAG: HAMP domain-containing protein [Acidobacteriota bacterium]|nr:HAMP domain-containing protein [Acidobacteriota bacterium]
MRHPRATLRGRLTLLIAAVLFASGAVLLAITYGFAHTHSAAVRAVPAEASQLESAHAGSGEAAHPPSTVVEDQHVADLNAQLAASGVALAIMAVLSVLTGWLVAGRVLRPLRAMTAAAGQISAESLDRRLAPGGPRDELKELGETIDGLLGRLQDSFDAQRRFVANASHELRTPLTASRALLEMVIHDPHATAESFRATCRQVLEEGAEQERLIDSLLLLARSQRGIAACETFDVAPLVSGAIDAHEPRARALGLRIDRAIAPAELSGDRRLVERLVGNLVDNAVCHNLANGHVAVQVAVEHGRATLTVTNTGPLVPPSDLERLLQPFQRLSAQRTGEHDGLGLGLSIAQAIATAHEAALGLLAAPGGGLRVEVSFPAPRSMPAAERAATAL